MLSEKKIPHYTKSRGNNFHDHYLIANQKIRSATNQNAWTLIFEIRAIKRVKCVNRRVGLRDSRNLDDHSNSFMHYIVNLAASPFDMAKVQSESSYPLLRNFPRFESFSQISSTVANSSRNQLHSDSMDFDLFKRYISTLLCDLMTLTEGTTDH